MRRFLMHLSKDMLRRGLYLQFCIHVLTTEWDFCILILQSYAPQCLTVALELLTRLLCVVQWCCRRLWSHGQHEVGTLCILSLLNMADIIWPVNLHCESKKLGHFYFYCNFGKCGPISIILSLLDSQINCGIQ